MNKGINQDAFLLALKKEENQAFKQLYYNAYTQVESFIVRNSGKHEDAHDTFQEGIIVLLKMLRKPDFKLTAKVSTLMYSICRNIWLRYLRDKHGKELNILDDDTKFIQLEAETETEEEAMVEERHVLIKNALESMGDVCKQVINSFYFKKMSHKEIASEMGYTDGYVRIRMFRCMKKLKSIVGLTNKENE